MIIEPDQLPVILWRIPYFRKLHCSGKLWRSMQCSWDQSSRWRWIVSWTIWLLQIPCWKRLFRHCFSSNSIGQSLLNEAYRRSSMTIVNPGGIAAVGKCRVWPEFKTFKILRQWIFSQTEITTGIIPSAMTRIVVSRETRHLAGWHRWHFWSNWKNRQVKNSSSNPSPLPSQTKRFVLHIDEIDMGMALSKIGI